MSAYMIITTFSATVMTILISLLVIKRNHLPSLKQVFISFDYVYVLTIIFLFVTVVCFYVLNYERLDLLTLLRRNILLFFGYVVSVEDFKSKRIPNSFVIGMISLWLLFTIPQLFLDVEVGIAYIKKSVFGFFMGGGLFLFVYLISKRGLGGGDVKFMAAAGLYLGFNGILPVILYGSVLSAIVGITLILLKRIGRKDAMPLAPFLYVGILLTVFRL